MPDLFDRVIAALEDNQVEGTDYMTGDRKMFVPVQPVLDALWGN